MQLPGGSTVVPHRLIQLCAKRFQNFIPILDLGQLARYILAKLHHLGHRLAVLALQPVKHRQPVLNLRQPLRRGIDALRIIAQTRAHIAQRGPRGLQLLRSLRKSPVVARQFLYIARRRPQRNFSRRSTLVKLLKSPHRCGVKLLGIGQHALLRLQRFIFAGYKMRRFDLLALVAPQVHHAQAVLLALDHLLQLCRRRAPARIGLAHGLGRKAAKAIQQNPLLRLVEAAQCLALRVNQRQLRRQQLEHGHGCRLVVYKHAALARRENLPAQDNLVAFRVDAVLFQNALSPGRGLKDAGDNGLIGPVPHYFHGGLTPHQQSQRIHQNRLTRTRFAGQQVQPWAKYGNRVINDSVVFSAQFNEHFRELLGTDSITRDNPRRVLRLGPSERSIA